MVHLDGGLVSGDMEAAPEVAEDAEDLTDASGLKPKKGKWSSPVRSSSIWMTAGASSSTLALAYEVLPATCQILQRISMHVSIPSMSVYNSLVKRRKRNASRSLMC